MSTRWVESSDAGRFNMEISWNRSDAVDAWANLVDGGASYTGAGDDFYNINGVLRWTKALATTDIRRIALSIRAEDVLDKRSPGSLGKIIIRTDTRDQNDEDFEFWIPRDLEGLNKVYGTAWAVYDRKLLDDESRRSYVGVSLVRSIPFSG
ncbi:hypothetical protein F4X90_06535 [Candidatus Poribacteria bacterium]|nr:hypothetical protein [Candidatus Poribacteria bacterium]